MKQNRLLLLAALITIVYCVPVSIAIGAENSVTWVNPAYKNLSIAKPPALLKPHAQPLTVCTSYSDVKAVLQNNFKGRITTFSFQMNYDFAFADVGNILSQAIDDVTTPDDYLLFNILSYNYVWNGSNGDVTVSYTVQYLTTEAEEQFVDDQVAEILGYLVSDSMTDEQKERAIHDWIVLNVQYDLSANDTSNDIYSAYGALANGTAVCQGYSLLNFKMLKTAGISARIISSNGMDHAWNMADICGHWYHEDVTWDDPIPDVPGRVLYTYFNKSDTEISADHWGWDASLYPAAPDSYIQGTCGYAMINKGDVNGNGVVDLEDAVLCLQICAGVDTIPAVSAADVNGDGRLDMVEAIYILQIVAGLRQQ